MRADVVPLVDRATVIREWAQLEPATNNSCFTSSVWIANWLATLPASVRVYVGRVEQDEKLVALALFGRASVPGRFGARDTFLLHATGDAKLDRLCIELNGILVRPEHAAPAMHALLAAMKQGVPSLDALEFPALRDASLVEDAAQAHRWLIDRQAVAAPFVDLRALRHSGRLYRDALRKKARYAIRQATQRYTGAFGPIRVLEASTADEASQWLEQLAQWNRTRWSQSALASAFEEAYFSQFHQRLVATQFETGMPRLLQVRFGAVCLGVVYVLQHRGWSAFYQCGYDYDLLGDKAQPGYAVLPAVIDHLAANGSDAFDFLGDDTHYKRMLATHTRDLVSLRLLRPHWRNRSELVAREWVRMARRILGQRRQQN